MKYRAVIYSLQARVRSRMSARRLFPRLSARERALFIKRLSFLLGANVPLAESLVLIARQPTRRGAAAVYAELAAEVERGRTLCDALNRAGSFDPLTLAIARLGEASGDLARQLNYLAIELDKRAALRRKVAGALAYPGIIAVAALGITAFLIAYIFPKIEPIFADLGVPLPIATRALIALSHFLARDWLLLALALAALVIAATLARRRYEAVRRFGDVVMLRLPAFGPLAQHYALGQACRSAGALIMAAQSAPPALRLAAEVARPLPYREALHAIADRAERGEALAAGFSSYPRLFPDPFVPLASIGERTGSLGATLLYLAELYEREVDERAKDLSSILEPVLMLAMGCIIGFVAISIITPIYGITQQLQIK